MNKIGAVNLNLWSSATAVALALFVLINTGFAVYLQMANRDRFQIMPHSWGWWAVNSLLKEKQPADVMLLGSSLVQRLVDEGEATYLNRQINSLEHRCCQHLEDKLTAFRGKPVSTFSYTVGGLHASDASVVASEMLKGVRQPRAIVYGIAPRDVFNNMLASPYLTETYQIMSKIGNLDDVAYEARTNTNEKFEYFVSSILAGFLRLYDYRTELANCFRQQYAKVADRLAARLVARPANPFNLMDQIALHMIPDELSGTFLIAPDDPKNPPCQDNRATYLLSYRPFRQRFYDVQFNFLERFLRITRERGIPVVFINMPLRNDNFEAMMPGFYARYQSDLKTLASKYGASLIDMNGSQIFGNQDFTDQVHLNGRGACKFVDAVAPRLAPLLTKPCIAGAQNHLE